MQLIRCMVGLACCFVTAFPTTAIAQSPQGPLSIPTIPAVPASEPVPTVQNSVPVPSVVVPAVMPIAGVQTPDGTASQSVPPAITKPLPLAPIPTQQQSLNPTAQTEKPTPPPQFNIVWNDGLFIQTPEKDFIAHIGGLMHYDAGWYTGSTELQRLTGGIGRFDDGTSIRRGRLWAEGTAYKFFDYKFGFEFTNAFSSPGIAIPHSVTTTAFSPGPIDAWITIKEVPFLGNIRIGNQREWFSLEQINGARFLEFMERSYLFDASSMNGFSNGRTPGISTFRTWSEDRIFTGIGVYKNIITPFQSGVGDGEYTITGRTGFLPIYCPDRNTVWFVGGAASHRDPVNDQVQIRARNAVRAAPAPLLNMIVNTGQLNATSQTLVNLQTAAILGSVTLQSEYLADFVHGVRVGTGPNLGTVPFQGLYVSSFVFFTNDHRTWNPKTMTFNRVVPCRNLGDQGGIGAVEMGVRYEVIDLTEHGVVGGRANSVTVGLNWYWNPNMKMQFNYDYLHRDQGTNPVAQGVIHSFGTRIALDF